MADEVFLDSLARYNASRSLAGKDFYAACYAPFVSLYLDQFGNALACCQNRNHVVGNVARQTLKEIWHGSAIRFLRESLIRDDLRRGCGFCESQFLMGNADGHFMRRFDDFPVIESAPAYPKLLEFSISNTCNLECVMCNGDWSSIIRTRREKKSPLPKVYPDRFFDELREFLPHLDRAYFYGGEPFLEREVFRIWDTMTELGLRTPCLVTTNGTQWNDRIERILQRLPFSFSVSIDGITRETFEKIRKNARFDDVMENLARFQVFTREHGTNLSLSHCLMVPNWHEFADYLLFAEEREIPVTVNTVNWPAEVSLFALPKGDLERVVRSLEARDDELRRSLRLNRHVWIEELDRCRHALRVMPSASEANGSLAVIDRPIEVPIMWAGRLSLEKSGDASMTAAKAELLLLDWSLGSGIAEIELDRSLVIDQACFSRWEFAALRDEDFVGLRFQDAGVVLQACLGQDVVSIKSEQNTDYVDDMTRFVDGEGWQTTVRAISVPRFTEEGTYAGLSVRLAYRRLAGSSSTN